MLYIQSGCKQHACVYLACTYYSSKYINICECICVYTLYDHWYSCMFIPPKKKYFIGFDPYPYIYIYKNTTDIH